MRRLRFNPARPPGTQKHATKLQLDWGRELEVRRQAGEIATVRMEAITFRLALKTSYTPDFEVVYPDGRVEYHEVKGHWEEDARAKIKITAEQFPDREFIAVTRDRRVGWQIERF